MDFLLLKYLKAAFVVYSISQMTVDFYGGSIDENKWELIERGKYFSKHCFCVHKKLGYLIALPFSKYL